MKSAAMLIVDKPAGLTSHDVVQKVRRAMGCRAGHTGTLDPRATGVLLVCLGKATRLARFLQRQDKIYDCEIRLGWATDSYDADGEPTADPVPVPALEIDEIRAALGKFVGTIEQVPPAFSAKKIRGQPAYKRARRGEVVEPDPVQVTIHSIENVEFAEETIRCRVHCGSGTYVRTLAHEAGASLGVPAHLAELRRISVGDFGLEESVDWEALEGENREALWDRTIDPARMFPGWATVTLNDTGLAVVANGGVIEPNGISERRRASASDPEHGEWVRVLRPDGTLLAAAEMLPGGMFQPRVVLG
ncbi:MAG: tRNA pseudouridine(55) synthase TruB [Acidobacteria bacterium]|nr:tRNA pseudouridine(55) synthase TruB [Acidobacteriota bacterium]